MSKNQPNLKQAHLHSVDIMDVAPDDISTVVSKYDRFGTLELHVGKMRFTLYFPNMEEAWQARSNLIKNTKENDYSYKVSQD